MLDEYTILSIRVNPKDEGSGTYPVEATLDDGAFFGGGEMRIQEELLLAGQLEPQAYGLLLFNALFSGPIRDAYSAVMGRAAAIAEGRVRVRLWITDGAAELHALPWERLYHLPKGQAVPLSVSTSTPFSRFTAVRGGVPQPIRESRLRLLFAIANPSDLETQFNLAPIDVEREVETLHHALQELVSSQRFEVTILPGQTGVSPGLRALVEAEGTRIREGSTSLEEILRALPDCDVFHFLGHGLSLPDGSTALFLEDTAQPVIDDELVQPLVASDRLPRLVFLAACESAKRAAGVKHPFVGLGPKLLKAGVPAVVAMQDKVLIDVARQLTADFYRSLLLHGQIDLALNQARLLLFGTGVLDWAIPVLFSRLVDNELVDLPSDRSLQPTHHLVAATEKALAAVRPQAGGPELVAELERLFQEWQKSYHGLVELESALRHTGEDPATFADQFTAFYHEFKDYYNSETWVDEHSLIQATKRLRDEVLPQMRPQLDSETFAQIDQALGEHIGVRGRLVLGFGEFLDSMDEAVTEIRQLVDSGDVVGAIRRKREIELQIAPSLRSSRKLLQQMGGQITAVDDLVHQQQALGESSQRLMREQGVDERVLLRPGTAEVPETVGSQIDQMLAAQRGIEARGVLASPETLYRLGMLAAYRRDYEVSLDYFRQATQAGIEVADAYQAIAWMQQSRAMHDLISQDYDAALDKLAEARSATGHIRPLEQALVFQGYIAKTQAQIAERQGRPADRQAYLEQMEQFFRRALELDSTHAGAHNGIGNVELMRGNPDAAIPAFERAIELNPQYTAAYHDLGAACWQKMKQAGQDGDRQAAQAWCRRALEAFQRTDQLAEQDPTFDQADRQRVGEYITWLQQQCGSGQ